MKHEQQHYHIVYILTKLELGGAQKVCLSLVQGLENHHHPVSLISGSEGVLVEEASKHKSVFLLPSMTREVSITGIFKEIKNFIALVRTLRTLKKQNRLIMVHTHSTKAGILGRWAALFAGVKHRIHTVHGYGFHTHQSQLRWLIVYLCEFFTSFITTHFVCVSAQDATTGARLLPGFARKQSLIRAAVDYEKFMQPATKGQNSLIIGTVACFKPQKNLFDLLKAFELVHNSMQQTGLQSPLLQIIGDGVQRKEIETWIAQKGLGSAIQLLGWQHNVADWMRQWKLFALSSLWEGLPCAIVEARLLKLPVVAYDVGGISEIIYDDVNGFLIPPNNWQLLSEKILLILQDHKLCSRLSTHTDNLEDFDSAMMVKNHVDLYAHLAAKSAHTRHTSRKASP